MLTKAPKGTKDVLPGESEKWVYLEGLFRDVCKTFGYNEIRTPVFEHTELFQRGIGETTDVVQKEMYTFEDKGKRSITLKPEGTAPAVRAFIENKLYAGAQPTKLFYVTPCFRYERPQAGRMRAFHQFGIEVFGSDNPSIDAEVIALAMEFFKKVGLQRLSLRINSIGCPKCRKEYNELLMKYLDGKKDSLCETCIDRIDKNPMRVIDCKNDSCKAAISDIPLMLDHICDECSDHFEKVKTYLQSMDVEFEIDPRIVRGLDYYSKTAFEIISEDIGAQSTVCGGGRYDNLVSELGGPDTPAIGFGMGIERLLLTIQNNDIELPVQKGLDIFIVTIGDVAQAESMNILSRLRENGISADKDHLGRSVKAQFKYSDKQNARFTVVLGEDEMKNDAVTLKDMKTSKQFEIKLSKLMEEIKERL
ncbi:histidyl-tRNA synthetase [Peptoclostridium litorale DSM 5388]|uniref:Histidine--tRNA ligase n=1 Tax=Peptoclostridium litorale DSM 5388 TaxID=1121324 RepID=A0A069RPM4_PEPLI|nr:histidine--tRNA ligase [Peptoclostridium litorale]KDR96097.1 histidine--tRNA ligase HisS [Peptoclostridium litorale DSM 5388]SIO04742.1 histidyl-tRNA synthetase [Peptoclostridium litorale DSM 5388]